MHCNAESMEGFEFDVFLFLSSLLFSLFLLFCCKGEFNFTEDDNDKGTIVVIVKSVVFLLFWKKELLLLHSFSHFHVVFAIEHVHEVSFHHHWFHDCWELTFLSSSSLLLCCCHCHWMMTVRMRMEWLSLLWKMNCSWRIS